MTRAGLLTIGALVCLAAPAAAQAPPPPPADRLASVRRADGSLAPSTMVVIRGQHLRLVTLKNLQRVAAGDPDVVGVEVLSSREALVLGKKPGATSLIFWYQDHSSEAMSLVIQADLSLLAAALRDIHRSIVVEAAPDRPAVVLRGVVPDLGTRRAAEEAARAYLKSAVSEVLVASDPASVSAPGTPPAPEPLEGARAEQGPAAARVLRERGRRGGGDVAVINLIRLETLPPTAEERIRAALGPVGAGRVTVRRIVKGVVPSDDEDTFVLEGTVPDQVALLRMLSVAARVLTGADTGRGDTRSDIRAIGDEAGGLLAAPGTTADQAGATGLGGVSSLTGSRATGSGAGQRLTNLVTRNIARARALSAAQGRILSFVDVADVPQVRVSAKLYEIKRSRLLDYSPQIKGLISSRGQPVLDPPTGVRVTRPDGSAGRVGEAGNQILNAFSFLAGAFTNQTQLVVGKLALDLLLSILETEGVARQLSAPSLTVLSGELAEFNVGGEIPIVESFLSPVVATGTGTPAGVAVGTGGVFNTVTFRAFGVSLGIRPLVAEDDTITLDLVPEVTTPDPELTTAIRESTGTALPTTAFDTRTLRTTARLQDGEAILIGGLLTRDLKRTDGSTPLLGQVPLLRYLFRNFRDQDDQTELVVVVNPVIVRSPVAEAPLWTFPGPGELLGGARAR